MIVTKGTYYKHLLQLLLRWEPTVLTRRWYILVLKLSPPDSGLINCNWCSHARNQTRGTTTASEAWGVMIEWRIYICWFSNAHPLFNSSSDKELAWCHISFTRQGVGIPRLNKSSKRSIDTRYIYSMKTEKIDKIEGI